MPHETIYIYLAYRRRIYVLHRHGVRAVQLARVRSLSLSRSNLGDVKRVGRALLIYSAGHTTCRDSRYI